MEKYYMQFVKLAAGCKIAAKALLCRVFDMY